MLTSIQSSGRPKVKLRWLDNGLDEDKNKLVTNDASKDLIHKEEGDVK
jgi:hypothetical protein